MNSPSADSSRRVLPAVSDKLFHACVWRVFAGGDVLVLIQNDRDNLGRFVKGHHPSPETEFKRGEHWRSAKAHWKREWLWKEYIVNFRSAAEIAKEMECTENNILYWLHKHNIPRRTVSEVRDKKYWGSLGKDNPMYGVTGKSHPNWKGGLAPARQALYNSDEWKQSAIKIRERDNHSCQNCGWREGWGSPSHIHHIVPFSESKNLRISLNNLILLCPICHHWVHSLDNTEGRWIAHVITE